MRDARVHRRQAGRHVRPLGMADDQHARRIDGRLSQQGVEQQLRLGDPAIVGRVLGVLGGGVVGGAAGAVEKRHAALVAGCDVVLIAGELGQYAEEGTRNATVVLDEERTRAGAIQVEQHRLALRRLVVEPREVGALPRAVGPGDGELPEHRRQLGVVDERQGPVARRDGFVRGGRVGSAQAGNDGQ